MKCFLLASLLLGLVAGPAQGQSAPFIVSDLVFSAGALNAESTSFRLAGTFGQPFAGRATSSGSIVTLGFWAAPLGTPEPTTIEPIEADAVPQRFSLDQNYPNPFNPATRIRYAVPEPASVRLTIHDVLGREVVMLVDRRQAAGTYEVPFEAGDLPSGMYFYRLETDRFWEIRQMILLK
jgi:hypothetical protein